MIVETDSEVYRWAARSEAWFFAALPEDLSADIREIPRPRAGFGAVRVQARVGATTWRTSIFPGGDGRYVLPLKRAVRDAEGLVDGGPVHLRLEIIDA